MLSIERERETPATASLLPPGVAGESGKFILNEIMYEIIAPIVYHAYEMNNIDISVPNLLSELPIAVRMCCPAIK
jgi:hypothetical protein